MYPIQCLTRKKGKSKPHLIRCSDGLTYLVKFKNNPQGTRTLVNDYIVSKLGLLLGLPIPHITKIYISDDFIRSCPLFDKYDFVGGYQFASFYMDNCPTLTKEDPLPTKDRIMNQAINTGLFLFDLWVSNRDRWKGNILLKPTNDDRYFLYLIDHSDCFPGGNKWTIESLKKDPRLKKLRSVHQWCLEQVKSRQELYQFATVIERLPNDQIKHIIQSIPTDWDVTQEEQNALFHHLVRGKEKTPQINPRIRTKLNLIETLAVSIYALEHIL